MVQQGTPKPVQPRLFGPDPARDLAPFVASPVEPWDQGKVAHLLRRAGFGPRPEEVLPLVQLGMDGTVDQLLATTTTGVQDSGAVTLSNAERVTLTTRVAAVAQWIDEMLVTQHPLKEKMALFWSDHFSVGAKMTAHEALLPRHINVFRQHGLGNLRDLLLAVTKDPAMLWWLDNNVNGRPENGRPKINENYARELLELYTMGVNSGYTQDDVREAAKCLSGWSTGAINEFVYRPDWHVLGDKTVLGKKVLSNGEREVYDLLDVILAHPATAKFLVGKIWSYFVSETPYPQLIDLLAERWRNSGYDIKFLMSTIFRSSYFYSSKAIKQLVKNPYEFAIQATRATGSTWRYYRYVDNRVVQMGYRLMAYSDPSGYDDGVAWIDEIAMLSRANFGNDLTRKNYYSSFDPNREINRMKLKSAPAIVDHYIEILGVDDVPAGVRHMLYLFMDLVDSGHDPFVFTNDKIDEKVRGLVHLILSLPEASIN